MATYDHSSAIILGKNERKMNKPLAYDVLIIGSGSAGLSVALNLAKDLKVAVVCKSEIQEGSTFYAQGGIAAVLDDKDSIESHIQDTLTAGAGLCHEDAVRFTVTNSAQAIKWLLDIGVSFDKRISASGKNELHLTREGGHAERRIAHAADATGKAVSEALIEQLGKHDNIHIMPQRVAVDIIRNRERCTGCYLLNTETNVVETINAKMVVLATGGASKAYLFTSNPDGATGDGIALAWRAGCRVGNMEFNQFHPTTLFHPSVKSFLITEAVRGEGGKLLLPSGERFMHRFDEREELAPRDIVARAIDHEMKRLGADCLFLDISHKDPEFIQSHFPTISKRCLELGIDISKQPIPVVPAAHYTCGGIVVDRFGRTDLAGLYAVGETTFTGLHGANRLASNSLLECIVYGTSAARHINSTIGSISQPSNAPNWDESQVTNSDEDVVISHNWDELRRFMWDYVGIVRSDKRLKRALNRVTLLRNEIGEYYSNYKISNDLLELRNLALVSELIIRCALKRKESRGLHSNIDYPDLAARPKDSILTPGSV